MCYLIDLRPGAEPVKVACPSGGLSREQVREIVGEEYSVIPTFITDLVLVLCGEGNEDENELATDMLSVTDNTVVRGRALLVRVMRNKITGLTDKRAEYWIRQLKE